jgi:hypothetical protein
MPRRNHRSHQPKRHRYADPLQVPRSVRAPAPQPNLSHLVLPVGKCGRKLMFKEADAPTALKQAQEKRASEGSANAEKRIYECPRCSHWHLTSRERYDERDGGTP